MTLARINGDRSVANIAATRAGRGIAEAQFRRRWADTFVTLSGLNRLPLARPA